MFNNMFSYDEIAARSYEAHQMVEAGYPDDAQMIRRQSVDLSPLFAKISDAVARFFVATRDLPAALAYDASQFADASYLPETCSDDKVAGLFENVTTWVMARPAPRTAAPCLADAVTP
jgi:hypothetical protein